MTDISSVLPRPVFSLFRPDEVAECWNGVTEGGDFGLYTALWDAMADVKPLAEAFDLEDCGPDDVRGHGSVSSLWDKFTPEQQARLNAIADMNA